MTQSIINAENKAQWQTLADQLSQNNPLHKRVRVVGGRKHKGKEGIMTKQMRDKYASDCWKYCSEAQATYREMEGVYGFCGLIECDDKSSFWIKCSHLEIISSNDTILHH